MKMIKTSLISFVILALAAVAPAHAWGTNPELLNCSSGVTTKAAKQNIRSGPSTQHGVVATLPKGNTVKVDSCNGGWCAVSFQGKAVGFASERLLDCTAPAHAGNIGYAAGTMTTQPALATPSSASDFVTQIGALLTAIDAFDAQIGALQAAQARNQVEARRTDLLARLIQEIVASSSMGNGVNSAFGSLSVNAGEAASQSVPGQLTHDQVALLETLVQMGLLNK